MKSEMTCSVRIKRSAAEELARIPKQDRLRIAHAIDRLGEHPLTGSALKGERRGLRRLRVGDCRIVYEVLEGALVLLAIRVARRRDVYRRR